MRQLRARIGKPAMLMTAAFLFALGSRLDAEEPEAATQVPPKPAQCEQRDTAWLAIRACSALLEAKDIDAATKSRYLASRGYAWVKEEEPQQAVEDFTKAIEANPANTDALTGRARANTTLGKHEAAATDWSAMIEKTGAGAKIEDLYLERGASWFAAGKPDLAIADYTKVLELNPKSVKAHIAEGAMFAAQGNRQKALEEFDKALAIDPQSFDTFIARAQAAERWGDTKMAIDNYTTAVKMNPRGAGPWRHALKRLGVDTPP